MRWRIGVIAAVAVLAGHAAFAADQPADALARINAFRIEHDLKPLRMEARLAIMARDQARDMIEKQYFGTRSPAGKSLKTRLADAGYAYRQAAQQVAVGFADGRTVVENLIRRGDSRQVLLNTALTETGIGYANRGGGALDHYWVITLAEPTQQAGADWQRDILRLVNRYRAANSLQAVQLDEALNRFAQGHADDMAARDYFDHVTPNGRTVGDRATAAGYPWQAIMENLAAGQQDPAEVVAGWIGSPPHRRAMLAPDIVDAGIG
ncbi:MAG: CAP domain-containing protein [Proteobacteria bacterium]|nr:CAP domain-containing protein [Pseudomonadota bacterium]